MVSGLWQVVLHRCDLVGVGAGKTGGSYLKFEIPNETTSSFFDGLAFCNHGVNFFLPFSKAEQLSVVHNVDKVSVHFKLDDLSFLIWRCHKRGRGVSDVTVRRCWHSSPTGCIRQRRFVRVGRRRCLTVECSESLHMFFFLVRHLYMSDKTI